MRQRTTGFQRRLGLSIVRTRRPARPVRLIVGLIAGLLAAAPAACLASPVPAQRAEGVPAHLTIASEGARPPYNYFDGDRLAGFEIDLGLDLCRRMATDCTFVSQDWDSLIPSLLDHRVDAIMAAMEITRARSGQISFTAPYVRMPSAFLVRKDAGLADATPNDLAGRAIGFERGGTHQAYVQQIYPRSMPRAYGSLSDAILDLEAGRVDAAIGDKDAIVAFLTTRRDASCCRILADVPRDPAIFGDGIAIGLRKGDTSLRAAFDAALAGAKADGTFARISGRYFAFPVD